MTYLIMKKLIRPKRFWLYVGLFIILWGILSFPYPKEPTSDDFPWWEKYYTKAWHKEWYQLIRRVDTTVRGGICETTAKKTWFTFFPLESIRWCYDPATRLHTRIHTGLWGDVLAQDDWNFDDLSVKYEDEYFAQFPLGPNAFLDPKLNWEKEYFTRPLTDQEIERDFFALAFGLDPDPFGNNHNKNVINKWMQPVRIVVDDWAQQLVNGKTPTQWIEALVVELRDITGLNIQVIDRGEGEGNFFAAFLLTNQREAFLAWHAKQVKEREAQSKRPDYRSKQLKDELYRIDSTCFGTSTWNTSNGHLMYAYQFIFLDDILPPKGGGFNTREDYHLSCINEETAQSFGLSRDNRATDPTLFNDYSSYLHLTELDKVLLSILYDQRIQPGMTREQARPIVRKIIQAYRQAGRLDQVVSKRYRIMF